MTIVAVPDGTGAAEQSANVVKLKGRQQALEDALQRRNLTHAQQNEKAERKLRLERQLGRILPEIITRGGDRKSRSHAETLKLADLGITKWQAHRWRVEASVPDDEFERWIAETKARGGEITSAGLYRRGSKLRRGERADAPGRDHRRNRSGLDLLEEAWGKATPEEQEAFLRRHGRGCDVSSEATRKVAAELITAGVHAMARKCHPDAGGDDASMRAVNKAAACLRRCVGRSP